MSRRCELTGIGPMVGNSVSHSNVKTKRRFLPSLRQINLQSEALGASFRLKISNAALRTLDFRGGLDAFIIKADDANLSIRARRLMGLGFRRQVPIAGYIVDFACPTHRLIVEVDGSQHGNDGDRAYDQLRTARLEADGWTVLRFWNDDVLRDISGVCLHIVTICGRAME